MRAMLAIAHCLLSLTCIAGNDDMDAHRRTDTEFSRCIATGWRPDRCDRVALVLQGGGALGAYQAGVYQALHEAGIEPDWVSRRFDRRDQCGDHRRQSARATAGAAAGTSGSASPAARSGTIRRTATSTAQRAMLTSSFMTMMQGQPGFFKPHHDQCLVQPGGRHDRHQLLRQRAAARDAARAGRLFDSSTSARRASRSARSTC